MKEKAKLFSQDYQKQPSEKHRYKHIHTGEYCTCEAYVAEFLVLRRAERLKLDKPSYKFWSKGDPNHWLWLKQFHAAKALIKKYSEEALVAAVKSKDFNRYLVIGLQNGRSWKINPVVIPIVAKHQKLIDEAKENQTTEHIEVKEDPTRRKATSGKKSIMNKLRGM